MDNPGVSNGLGEWLFPNGTRIDKDRVAIDDGFYWKRENQAVSLHRQGNIQIPLGPYCCVIPDRDNTSRTFCANIAGKYINMDFFFSQFYITYLY